MTPYPLVAALRKNDPPLHQTSALILPNGSRIPPTQHLFLRAALLAPFVEALHNIDGSADLELDGLPYAGIAYLKGVYVAFDVGLRTRFLHLDA